MHHHLYLARLGARPRKGSCVKPISVASLEAWQQWAFAPSDTTNPLLKFPKIMLRKATVITTDSGHAFSPVTYYKRFNLNTWPSTTPTLLVAWPLINQKTLSMYLRMQLIDLESNSSYSFPSINL